MRVCVSEVIPGRVYKCIHGVRLPSSWAFTSDRKKEKEKCYNHYLRWQLRSNTIPVKRVWECKAGSVWRGGGSRPPRRSTAESRLIPELCSPVLLTGCANKLAAFNSWMECLCWKCHLVALFYPSQTALQCMMGICQQHFHSADEEFRKKKLTFSDKVSFLKRFNGTSTASAFQSVMSLCRFKSSVPERWAWKQLCQCARRRQRRHHFLSPHGENLFVFLSRSRMF